MLACVVCSKLATSECSKCKLTYYCGIECQTKDWASHQNKCSENIGVIFIAEAGQAEDLLIAIYDHRWKEIISKYARMFPERAMDTYGREEDLRVSHKKEIKEATDEFVKYLLDSFDKRIDITEQNREDLKELFEKLNQIFYQQISLSRVGDIPALERKSDKYVGTVVEIRDLMLNMFSAPDPKQWPEIIEAYTESNRQETEVMRRIFNHFHGTITRRKWMAAKTVLIDVFLSPLFTALRALPSK